MDTNRWKVELSSAQVSDASWIEVQVHPRAFDVSSGVVLWRDVAFPLYKVEAQTWLTRVAVPYYETSGRYPLVVFLKSQEGRVGEVRFESVQVHRRIYPSETLRVDPDKVAPPDRLLVRILSEKPKIRSLYAESSMHGPLSFDFIPPLTSKITSRYGNQRVYNGMLKGEHSGTDFRAATGTPIRAPADGVVIGTEDLFFTGNTLFLDHGGGLVTFYAHLSRFKRRVGDKIKQGEIIALSGNTGRSTGPHLHWSAVLHGQKFDPEFLLRR